MDKAFHWFVATGVVLFLYVRLTGSSLLFASLIYSALLLGCYFYLFTVSRRNLTKPNQER